MFNKILLTQSNKYLIFPEYDIYFIITANIGSGPDGSFNSGTNFNVTINNNVFSYNDANSVDITDDVYTYKYNIISNNEGFTISKFTYNYKYIFFSGFNYNGITYGLPFGSSTVQINSNQVYLTVEISLIVS